LLLGCTVALVVVAAVLSLRTGPGRVLVLILLLGCSIAVGLVFGNATSLALAAARHRAGAGSAVLGALQFAVGGLASPLVGLGGAGTALPMALTMVSFALLAAAALLCSPRQPDAPGHPRSRVP
jgi:MFS transporter, DHA1 family, multidrug resistance protein